MDNNRPETAINHFPKHVGDWRTATGKLTRVQRDIYSELIDTYYDKEAPLTADFERLAEDQACRTPEERAALQYVLNRFFTLREVGGVLSYTHERCDEEIEHFNHKSQIARASGRKGGLTPRASRKMKRTPSERQADAKPEDSGGLATPDPRPQIKKDSPDGESKESGVDTPPSAAPPPPPATDAGPEEATPKKRKPSRKCPPDFAITAALVAWASEKVPALSMEDLAAETDKFRDNTFKTPITDWDGAWRNWMRNAVQYRRERVPQRTPLLQARAAARDDFTDRLLNRKGEHDAGSRIDGALDVESRVVREAEADPSDEGAR